MLARMRRAWRRLSAGDPFGRAAYRRWIERCERRDAPGGPDCEYLLGLGPGDELAPHARAHFAAAVREGADLIYCDEDRLDKSGRRVDPRFKPDWSPDLLDACDYIGRAVAFRRELGSGSARELAASARHIVHIPRVLVHCRDPQPLEVRRVRYPVPPGWRVDIIVPSRDARLLAQCLESVAVRTAYRDYTFTVIDNSNGSAVAAVTRRFGARYVDWRGRSFNHSAMNNEAVSGSSAPGLLFLNDDTSVLEPGWLEAMAEHAARPEVGAVGARLLYPNGRIQHAGVVIGIYGVCGHIFKGWPGDRPTYMGLAETMRNVSAVTGACLMTREEVFRAAGGFDASQFPSAYNDIDLCLRIGETGRRVLYTPYAELAHHEAYSKPWRNRRPEESEISAFQARWNKYVARDPFYNSNLTREDEMCDLQF